MTVSVAKVAGRSLGSFLADNIPYLVETVAICVLLWAESLVIADCWLLLAVQATTALVLYLGVNFALKSVIQKEMFRFLRGGESKFA